MITEKTLRNLLLHGLTLNITQEGNQMAIKVYGQDGPEVTQYLPVLDHLYKTSDCIDFCINKINELR